MHAAVADTLADSPLDADIAEDFLAIRSLPEHVRSEAMAPLPRGWSKLRARPNWATGVLPGIEKELKGMWEKGVYEAVPCPPGRESEVIPTIRLTVSNRMAETSLVSWSGGTRPPVAASISRRSQRVWLRRQP
jgi:hypothetical protein